MALLLAAANMSQVPTVCKALDYAPCIHYHIYPTQLRRGSRDSFDKERNETRDIN